MRRTAILFAIAFVAFPMVATAGPVEVWPSPRHVVPNDNGDLEFELVVANTGVETARDVVVSDTLPQGTTLVRSEPYATTEGPTVRWSLGDVPPGGSATVTVVLRGGVDGGASVAAQVGTPRTESALPIVIGDPNDPVASYRGPTLDADSTDPEVLAVVARHDGDPVALAEFVQQRIAYEPYRGSLRGARGTIWTGAGNSTDQASTLVALLRAAGVPARYARGTIADEDAAALIASIFPERTRGNSAGVSREDLIAALQNPELIRGQTHATLAENLLQADPEYLAEVLFPNPSEDVDLLARTREHTYVQMYMNGDWVDVDPVRGDLLPSPDSTFGEVADEERHYVTVRASSESFNPLFGNALGRDPVERLNARFASVQLVGRPLGLRNAVHTVNTPGLVFAVITHTYNPELLLDGEVVARGEAFQELFSNFPGGNEVLTGYFLDVTVESPGEPNFSYRHTLFDRIGAFLRGGQFEENQDMQLGGLGQEQAITNADVTSIHVAGHSTPNRAVTATEAVFRRQQSMARSLVPELERIQAQEGHRPTSPEAIAFYKESMARAEEVNHTLGKLIGLNFLETSDVLATAVAETVRVRTWNDKPRLLFVRVGLNEYGPELHVDIARNDVVARAPEDIGRFGEHVFHSARGLVEASVEGNILKPWAVENVEPVFYKPVFDAANAQGVQMRTITLENSLDLYRLDISLDARQRLFEALQKGRHILMPEGPVELNGRSEFMWLEYDPDTGRLISADAQGFHPSAVEYAVNLARNLGYGGGFAIGAIAGFFTTVGFNPFAIIPNAKNQDLAGQATDILGLIATVAGCFIPGVGPPGFGLGVGIGSGSPLGIMNGILSVLFAAIAASPPVPGVAAFAKGLNDGICFGTLLGILVLESIQVAVLANDPHLPAFTTDVLRPVRRPPNVSRASVELDGGIGVRGPPDSTDATATLSGELDCTWEDTAALGAGELTGDGVWFDLIADELILDGDGVADVVAARNQNGGSASVTGSATGREVASLTGAVSAQLQGETLLIGTVGEGEETLLTFTGAATMTTRVAGAAAADCTTTDGLLSVGRSGWRGFAGAVALGAGSDFEGEVDGLLEITSLPQTVTVDRGEVARFTPQASSSFATPVEWTAEGPEHFDVFIEDGEIQVTPEPGTAAGSYDVHVWATAGDLRVGDTVTVTLRADDLPVQVSLTHDPLITVRTDGVDVPLFLRAEVVNRGAADTFTVTATVPEGYTSELAMGELTLAPGERGEIGVAVRTVGALPAPGTQIPVSVEAAGQTTASADATLTVPGASNIELTLDPPLHHLVPGTAADVRLRIVGRGNAPSAFQFRVDAPRFLQLEGIPAELEVSPGDDRTFPLRVSLTEDATVGLWFSAVTTVHRGEVRIRQTAVNVEVVGPDANVAICAAEVARELQDVELERALLGLSNRIGLTQFRCDNGDIFYLGQSIDLVVAELTDPAYAGHRQALVAYRNGLGEATCESLDVEALSDILSGLKATMEAVRDHDFRISLTPAGRVLVPAQMGEFSLRIERLGQEQTTLDLSLEEIGGTIASPAIPAPLIEDHAFTVEPERTGRTAFRVRASPREAPELVRTVSGIVAVEESWVRLGEIGANPPFAIPGATLRPYVDIFNVVNVPLDVAAHVQVRRPDDSLLWETEEPVQLHVPVSESLRRYQLGHVRTFDEDAGHYTIHVQLHRAVEEDAIPGGSGSGVVFIGQPFDASLSVTPPLLPPGDVTATVTVGATRRPLNVLPGVGNPTEIQRFATDTAGPAGLTLGPDGFVYFASFGTERSSDIPGHVPGRTVGRITDLDTVETFATIPNGVAGVTVGPDGAIYATNVGNPEHFTRIALPDGEVSTWFNWEGANIVGGGVGENITGIVFDDAGNAYGTELFEPFIFGITYPGERIYRVTPDGNNDGMGDVASTFIEGFQTPTLITIDRRTQDLFTCDTGNDRVARVTTVGEPALTTAIGNYAGQCGGLHFDEQGNLFVLNDALGEVHVFATEVVDGHTEITSELNWLLGGLLRPYDIIFDRNGHIVSSLVDEDTVVRILMEPASPPPAIDLTVEHQTAGDGVDEGSAEPNLGDDGPIWEDGQVRWRQLLASEDNVADFTVEHDLVELEPGDVLPLSDGTRLTYTAGDDAEAEVTLPALLGFVDHAIGLNPDLVTLRRGTHQRITVTLRNHRTEPDTFALFVDGIEPTIDWTMPREVEVPAQGEATVELRLTARHEAESGMSQYSVRVISALGTVDRAVGRINVDGDPIVITTQTLPPSVRWGQRATIRATFAKSPQDGRRGFTMRSYGLSSIVDGGRELYGIVDYLRTNTIVHNHDRVFKAPAGTYPFRIELTELGGQGRLAAVGTGTVTITNEVGVEVTADPPLVIAGRSQPFTLTAVISNPGTREVNVRLSRCCGPAFWGPSFNAGPHRIGPGQQVRVPIRMSPNGILVGDYGHRLEVEDVNDPDIRDQFTATVRIVQPGANLSIQGNAHPTAFNGEATITARLRRAQFSPGARWRIAYESALAFNGSISGDSVDLTQVSSRDFQIRFRDLQGLAPGPWTVRVYAWPEDNPDIVFERFASVTIPDGGLTAEFTPQTVVLPSVEESSVLLSVLNHDYEVPHTADIALEVDSEGLDVEGDRDALDLAGGGRDDQSVSLLPSAPGDYQVTATVTPDEGEAARARLRVIVLDPANAPVIDEVTIDPDPALEGTDFQLTIRAHDPNEEPILFDIDTDGDGEFDIEGTPEATNTIRFADDFDGELLLRARDREGGFHQLAYPLVVENVAPLFDNEPSLVGAEAVPYRFTPETSDPGEDTVTVALTTGPEGATFDNGTVAWTPTEAQAEVGSAQFVLTASDEDGGSTDLSWIVSLDRDNTLPSAPTPIFPVDGAAVGASVNLRIAPAIDPDGDELTYTYEVYAGDTLVADEETTTLAAAVTLDGVGPRAWRVRAHDGIGYGPWSATASFTLDPNAANLAPEAPVIVFPVADTPVDDHPATALWEPAFDAEADALTYDVEVVADGSDLPVYEATAIEPGEDDPIAHQLEDLVGGARWTLRVRAADAFAAGPWAEVTFDVTNRPPEAPTQISPVDGATVDGGEAAVVTVPMTFTSSTDPDGHTVSYIVEVFTDPERTTSVFRTRAAGSGEAESTVSWDAPAVEATYFWTVTAIDELDAVSEVVGPEEFNILRVTENQAPLAPVLVAPVTGAAVSAGSVQFVFEAAADPDGDEVTHTFVLRSGGEEVERRTELSGATGQNIEFSLELGPGDYSWTAWATDIRGLDGPEANAEQFKVGPDNLPPTTPRPVSPVDGAEVEPGALELVVEPSEDPEGGGVSYHYAIYADGEDTPVWTGDSDDTTVAVPDLDREDGAVFTWEAWATDASGLESPRSVRESFIWTLIPEGPNATLTGQRDCECQTTAASPWRWWLRR